MNNSNEFKKLNIFEDDKLNELIYSSINYAKSLEFAKIIFYFYENVLMYAEHNEWYMFDNHIWKNIYDTNQRSINNIIQTKLNEIYTQVYVYYYTNDNDTRKINAIRKIICSLNNVALIKQIISDLKLIYSNEKNKDFMKKLDANFNLLAFNNGIYDLQNFEFRNGKPEDYISMSINYDYSENHTEKYEELLNFLEDILPNEPDRAYFLTYLGIALSGNKLEKIIALIGSGANGKSRLLDLLNTALDNHVDLIPSQYFTQLQQDQTLLNLWRKRIVCTESEPDKKLNCQLIKCFLHHNSIPLRKIYSSEILDVSFNFTPILLCNTEPKFDNIDYTFSQHLKCINFPTQFVNNPINDNQKKRNCYIRKNFDHWKVDFMLLLIEYRKNYYKTGELIETDNIMKLTNQCMENVH